MIPLFRPYVSDSLPLLDEILHSGQLSYGKYSKQFESALAHYIGIPNVLCTSSFNTAYLIALKTLGLKQGDQVIASPMCCLASSQPLAMCGLDVVWADIDPAYGILDPESVKKLIGPKTRAIIHNHFCGYAGYITEIEDIARNNGLLLIDDVSEAFGTEYNGTKAGNWGADATVYSFQTVRLPNAIDMGGVSFLDSELYATAGRLRDYGIDRSRFRDTDGEIWDGCDITEASYGALPNDVNAYVGFCSLDRIDDLLARQRANARYWQCHEPQDFLPLRITDGSLPDYWIYGGLSKNKRDFIRSMKNDGYFVSGIHLPNYYYSLFGCKSQPKGVQEFHSQFVGIPCGWWMNNGVLCAE